MPPELTRQQKQIVNLAKKGGTDASFLVLKEVHDLEAKVEKLKENMPDLNKVLVTIKGADGEDGANGKKGDKGDKGDAGKDGKDGRDGIDGRTPTNGEIERLIEPLIPAATVVDEIQIANSAEAKLEQNIPRLGAAIRNALELLDGEDRLNVSAIEGIESLLAEVKDTVKKGGGTVGWGAHPLMIQQSGTIKTKIARVINFTGATVSQTANGVTTVAVTGGGSGWTIETPTGTVNGVNKTFIATATPKCVVADGITYFENDGYTLSTFTITMTVAPTGFIRDYY